MGIKNMIVKAGTKAANKVSQLAALSPEQMLEVQELKDAYLSEMPDLSDSAATELTMRLLATAGVEIYNAYLPQIKDLYLPLQSNTEYEGQRFKASKNIRYFNITKWVTDKKENNLEKLVNVYANLSNDNCNIALIFHRTVAKTDVYFAVTNLQNSDSNVNADNYISRLVDALRGNFPGAEWKTPIGKGTLPIFEDDTVYSVACASNIPTEKSEKFLSQTIEKLLDGSIPKKDSDEYTLILLATPVLDVEERKLRLAELYSGLAPYAGWQTNYTFTQSDSTNSMATFGVNAGVSAGIQRGQNQASTQSLNETESENQSITDSSQESQTLSNANTNSDQFSEAQSHSVGLSESDGFTHTDGTNVSDSAGGGIDIKLLHGKYDHSWGSNSSDASSHNISNTVNDGVTQTAGHSISETISNAVTSGTGHAVANALGRAVTKGVAKTVGTSKGINYGGNFGANFARSSNVTATVGKNEGITQSYTNYTVKHTLEVLEEQMKRYENSVALGMWDFAAYVLSENVNVVNNVAHSYIALTQGEKSYLSQAAINIWRGNVPEEKEAAKEINEYLRELRHPQFVINPEIVAQDNTFYTYPAAVTATTSLSGKELAYSLNFPQKSVVGLPVLQCAEFGRNVVSYEDSSEKKIDLGDVFHMNHVENIPIKLDLNSMSGHTFITGSTGSGKSNTVFQLLNEARKNNVHFLVVEPAKGEYKTVFGHRSDVNVYGTNRAFTPLLRIDPFSFPENIHVLEHLDRLVEIFNVCWPMYAAMPAVLKNAIEVSYEDCGWNLTESTNEYGDNLYPNFSDVARNVKKIIDSSEYDAENKGAYKGSLLTRLQSLTNGINGLIFTSDEIESKDLFDRNVIVDLSRVGSSETKSLIMGMLVLKLQEYRMSSIQTFNNEISHITVLEEAHNLLKRTSTEQSTEGGNLLGKSVEMLANAIAEMRTYGEGFIIADQAPGLLDMSVIRNTNTKIIMRLPDESDRNLVGKSANLNDDQIKELAKLPLGVGALYQNDWIQPVLCKVQYFKGDNKQYINPEPIKKTELEYIKERMQIAELLSKGTKLGKEVIIKEIKPVLSKMKLSSSVQVITMKLLCEPPKEPRMTRIAPVMAELFRDCISPLQKEYLESSDPQSLTEVVNQTLNTIYDCNLDIQVKRDIIQSLVTYFLLEMKNDTSTLNDWYDMNGGLVNVI